ncbi:hypothetical protein [Arthrobacter sedimenti]|uniref:hypothetical protein n=1 Tax=Arthrobacter sedimenti TaxID=2694931 RepID=UPI000B34E6FE|nr:hypothetical protein [Arthrobacter sedimenti]OUM43345.1 hypothetical protein B8W73_05370 [Arthrobacter agilis]
MSSRISPDEPFPADLGRLRDQEVEVLNSKVHREIEHEWAEDGEVDPETASRKDEIADELDDRDAGPRLTLVPQQDDGEHDGGHDGERDGAGRGATVFAGERDPAPGGTGTAGGA